MSADWAMFWITLVYVVATIVICIFNGRSAKATQQQVIESQRQFEETKRLEFMPFIQFEVGDGRCDADYKLGLKLDEIKDTMTIYGLVLRFKNIGAGSAIDIKYSWQNFARTYESGAFVTSALQNGDARSLHLEMLIPKEPPEKPVAAFELTFFDLLNHQYRQRIEIRFDYSSGRPKFKSVYTYVPEYVG